MNSKVLTPSRIQGQIFPIHHQRDSRIFFSRDCTPHTDNYRRKRGHARQENNDNICRGVEEGLEGSKEVVQSVYNSYNLLDGPEIIVDKLETPESYKKCYRNLTYIK